MTTKSAFSKLEKKFGQLSFGDMIRAWRESAELSQTAFAKKLGLSVQNLNDIEKGRRIPTPKRASLFAKKLGLPEKSFIQIVIRDSLLKEGFDYFVMLEEVA